MPNTNDALKVQLEGSFPGHEAKVEGSSTALSPFRVSLKKDNYEVVVETSMTYGELVEALKHKLPKVEEKPRLPVEDRPKGK